MSHLSDWFGGADRTVLQHPTLHAQRRLPNATLDGASVAGENVRVPNTIVVNEIQGGGLGGQGIVLPEGKFKVRARASWKADDSTTQNRCQLQLRLADGTVLVQGVNDTSRDTHNGNVAEVGGIIELPNQQEVIISQWITNAVATDGLGEDMDVSGGFAEDEVYADIFVEQLDERVVNFTVNDPSFALARPLTHIQEKYPNGSVWPTYEITTWTTVALNTEVMNQIVGASFNPSTHTLTLAPGTYDFDLKISSHVKTGTTQRGMQGAIAFNGNKQIYSNVLVANNENALPVSARERVTLAVTTDVTVEFWMEGGGTTQPTALFPADHIHADLQIRQQDALSATPVLVNDKLFPLPGGVIVTGNMHGLQYSRKNDLEVTVQPGICMDSLNETVLTLAAAQDVSIPATPSAYHNLFLCDDGFVRTDTDDNGAGLVGYKIRWIGYVWVSPAGIIALFLNNGSYMSWGKQSECNMDPALGAAFAVFDHTPYMPVSRIELIKYGHHGQSTTATDQRTSLDGTATEFYIGRADSDINLDTGLGAWGDTDRRHEFIPFSEARQFLRASASTKLCYHQVKMKR